MPRIWTSTLAGLHTIRQGHKATLPHLTKVKKGAYFTNMHTASEKSVKNGYNETMTNHTFLETGNIQLLKSGVKKEPNLSDKKRHGNKATRANAPFWT